MVDAETDASDCKKLINWMGMSLSRNTTWNELPSDSDKIGRNTPQFTVFGFYTAEAFLLAPETTSSCVLCHHMHEKGPSKNTFLSFQAISLIPDELQGRWKHYGCGLAGGGDGIFEGSACFCVCMWANTSLSEYISIIAKPCVMIEPFYFQLLFIPTNNKFFPLVSSTQDPLLLKLSHTLTSASTQRDGAEAKKAKTQASILKQILKPKCYCCFYLGFYCHCFSGS